MEYLDLSPYEYAEFPLDMICVGWLGGRYGLQSDRTDAFDGDDLNRLRAASSRVSQLMLGTHECEFCPEGERFHSSGEYHYYLPDGRIFAAPQMIVHYAERHRYRPPRTFLDGLKAGIPLEWDARPQHLYELLMNDSEDLETRASAVEDLANWKDRRVLDALSYAARDDILGSCASREIGISLGLLLELDLAQGFPLETLPQYVRNCIPSMRVEGIPCNRGVKKRQDY